MIAKLEKKKAEADATNKIYGDKELAETNSKKADKSDEIEDLPPMRQSSLRRITPIGGSEMHHPSDKTGDKSAVAGGRHHGESRFDDDQAHHS